MQTRRTPVFAGLLGALLLGLPGPAGPLGPQPSPEVRTSPVTASFASHGRPATGSGSVGRGTDGWRGRLPANGGQIAGYTVPSDGPPGTTVDLKVSDDDASFAVVAYRFGAYRGGPAHVVARWRSVPGVEQPPPVMSPRETRTVSTDWSTSLEVDTTGWQPGLYAFRLTSAAGLSAVTPYVVTSTSTAGTVAMVVPLATWQAYNKWGGYSLYQAPAGEERSWAVSFDRPYLAPGAGEIGYGALPAIEVAESTGVPLSYLADVQLDHDPGLLDGARGYVDTGHSEYWTQGMRAAVEGARDRGTNLAFLGANTAYWRVRLGATSLGPDRLVTGYRTDAALDPANQTDPAAVTGRFRDPPASDPEDSLTGMQYECFPVDAPYVVRSPHWWGFDGTDVHAGTSFAHLVGNEADRVHPGASLPRPLQVLADTSYSCLGAETSAQSTYYTAPSGAGVFATGTLGWPCALTGRCFAISFDARTVRFVRTVTANVIRGFAAGPVGLRHPALDDVARYHLSPVDTVPAS